MTIETEWRDYDVVVVGSWRRGRKYSGTGGRR